MKTLDDSFRDWESEAFGFGYGSGEEHVIPALYTFLAVCQEGELKHGYDYHKLEAALTPPVTWLLINRLCQEDVLEYGVSPRFGWLTSTGKRLQTYIFSHTIPELLEVLSYNKDYTVCYRTACNCGPDGYVKGAVCANPFWR